MLPELKDINFRALRLAKGLRLIDVEDLTGVNINCISLLERKKSKFPSYSTVSRLLNLYNQ